MVLFGKTRRRRARKRRIAAIQAACDHEWKLIEIFKGEEYQASGHGELFYMGSPTVLKYKCRKCEKARFATFEQPT